MCLGALVSCGATCCAGCCCSAFADCKAQQGPGSRIPYMFIMFIMSAFAICMAMFGEEIVWENDLLDYSFQVCSQDSCRGNGAIYRTSFSLFVFFLVHSITVHFVPSFHHLFFVIKLFCLVAVLTATFFIPGTFFEDGYVQFARVGSGVFLLIQIYVLIGWAWDCNERIVEKIDSLQADGRSPDADEDEKANQRVVCCFQSLLIGGTLGIYAAIIVFWVFQFQWFVYITGDASDCTLNQAMCALMVVLVLVLSVLPPLLQNGSIFTTAIVSFYVSYLTFAALEASDNAECNWFANHSDDLSLWLGFGVTIAAISYTGFSVSKHFVEMSDGSGAIKAAPSSDKETAKEHSNDDEEDGAGTSNYDDVVNGDDDGNSPRDEKAELMALEKKANVTFHVCMTFAAVYMCMLYTGWGDDQISSDAKARGTTAMVVNLLCVWITALLYGWTLVAPKCCPDRFGNGDDDEDQEINMEI